MPLLTQHTLREVDPFHRLPHHFPKITHFGTKVLEFDHQRIVWLSPCLELHQALSVAQIDTHRANQEPPTHGNTHDSQDNLAFVHRVEDMSKREDGKTSHSLGHVAARGRNPTIQPIELDSRPTTVDIENPKTDTPTEEQ